MKPVIVIAGPTCVGKSNTAVRLAQKIGGEVLSADSIQVYKGLDIGSAKVTEAEMQGVPHHLIDILEPTEEYNVALFQKMGREALTDILSRGKTAIVTGGTGFYIQALIRDVSFAEEADDTNRRNELMHEAEGKDALYLFRMLQAIDPVTAEKIDPYNKKRVARAIEFYESTGSSLALHNEQEKEKEYLYPTLFVVLTDDREKLYERINRRVDKMEELGLIDEVRWCYESGIPKSATSMQGIGYKEIYEYLEGSISKEEAIEKIKQNSRHFAKRQVTWFKREKDAIWINVGEYDYDIEKIADYIISLSEGETNGRDF